MDVIGDAGSLSWHFVKRGTIALLMAMPAVFRLEQEWYTARDQVWIWGRLVRRTHTEGTTVYVWEDVATGKKVTAESAELVQQSFARMLIQDTLFSLSPTEWNASVNELQDGKYAFKRFPI